MLLSPVFLAIPSFATAPALIIVGFYMLSNVINIDFKDYSEAIPCYICIGAMPFFYSISEGIAMGVISYAAIHLLTGRYREKKISLLMYCLLYTSYLVGLFLSGCFDEQSGDEPHFKLFPCPGFDGLCG